MADHVHKPTWLTLALWLVANTLSFGFVGGVLHNFPLAFTFPPNLTRLGSFSLASALLGGVLFGFVPALVIGFLQWWILRRTFGFVCSLSTGLLWLWGSRPRHQPNQYY